MSTAVAETPDTQSLRERLTEREDENRVEDPWTVQVLGHSLSVNGQFETGVEVFDSLSLGESDSSYGQALFVQELEFEAFYVINESFSFFAQGLIAYEDERDSKNPDQTSSFFFERGEMWLYFEMPTALPLILEIGRLDFEDDRLWFWDSDLDAARLEIDGETVSLELAIAEELFEQRSDTSGIDPEEQDVRRIFGEVSWEIAEEHALDLFFLDADDQSGAGPIDGTQPLNREDESDADLTWVGARLSGGFESEGTILGYWIDAATVQGEELLIAYEDDEETPGHSVIEAIDRVDVDGWALDTGFTLLLAAPAEPRLTLAFASGSGDSDPDDGKDKAFHQTGLHGNEPGFGGVERFLGYGEVLDPELSNLRIFTAGIGVSLLENSSIDFAYHHYELLEFAEELRDARIEAELTGTHRDIGDGFDLVLGIEEWERLQFRISGSLFQAGSAFGRSSGDWISGAQLVMRYAF